MAFSSSQANSSRNLRARFAGPALILLAAVVATVPQLFRGNSCGHDFDIHLVSWFDCLNSWRHGIAYPQWTPSANYGAGEPRFIFYPPLTWMLGAALGLVFSWQLVPIVLTFLLLAATGLATRALALRTLAIAPATLAGCAAIFSGYALFTAYERSAFGELAAFWIPLLLLFTLRDRNASAPLVGRAFDGSAVPLALVVAGAWLSNAPLGVMASYLLAAVALTLAVLHRSWAPILRAATAAALGAGLAAFYLVPAAWEQRWVDIRQATDDPGLKIENSFLFGHPADPQLDLHNLELTRASLIVLVMVAVSLGGLAVAVRRKTLPADRRLWIPLALIPLAVLFLQLPISLPVWNLLPKLRFLQFPWRWLVVLEAPMAVFFAAAVWPRAGARRWVRIAVSAASALVFLAATAVAAIDYFQPCDDEDAVAPMIQVYRSGQGFEGVYEYAPIGADDGMVATGLPDACLVSDPRTQLGVLDTPGTNPDWWVEQHSCDATFTAIPPAKQDNPEHFHIGANLPHAGFLILRLHTYPAWRLTLNGRPAGLAAAREDGLTVIAVPQGRVDLAADWTTTADVRAGRWLTVLALLLVTAVWLLERRDLNRRAQAPSRSHLS
ncbi:MAG TPA: 6-pyruvoyl-tetrahydropterin synthase-related protein [Terracidiphilus sp.]|nr:6-pyruvoyl-tetrahydropterin synthase-related protein [Terracidiphilus sp.]